MTEIDVAFTGFKPHDNMIKCRIGLAQLKRFTQKYKQKTLDGTIALKLVQVAIKCASIFHYRIDMLANRYNRRKTAAEAKVAFNIFRNLMAILYSSHSKQIIPYFIQTLDSDVYLTYTTLCENFFKVFLATTSPNTDVIIALLDKIEEYAVIPDKCERPLHIFRWLSNVVAGKFWPHTDVDVLMRLLYMHNKSAFALEEESSYFTLLAGLQICLRRSIGRAAREGLEEVIKYQLIVLLECDSSGELLDYLAFPLLHASFLYRVSKFSTSIHPSMVKNILLLIASENRQKSIFGNRTFQHILDTRRNMEQLSSTRIFFLELSRYQINIQKANAVDENFIRTYRKELHVSFLTAIIYHADELSIIKNVYTSMALLITELPCPYTAAFLVCLVMQIQSTFQEQAIPLEASHRVHAVVISIMSLVCWIMNAKVLYKYVNTILKRRANTAPFLNPPLRETYKYANHYILWNKAEYFFESYEVRYALWKRFRLVEVPGPVKKQRRSHDDIPFF